MEFKHIFKILIAVLLLLNCQEKLLEKGKYRINGTVKGLTDGEFYITTPSNVDTIKVVKGSFNIERELKEPANEIFLAKSLKRRTYDKKNNTSIFVEPKIMELVLDYENFSNSILKGSDTQEDSYKLDSIRDQVASKYAKEQAVFDVASKKYREAATSGASAEELEVIKKENYLARKNIEVSWIEQGKAVLRFIKDNPNSYLSMKMLSGQLGDIKYDEAKLLYDNFNPIYVKTEAGKHLLERINNMKKGMPGALAANFETVDVNGNPIKLSDFKGNYLLIDFWGSWCVPCRKRNPHLISLYKKYNLKGLEILGIAVEDNLNDWRKAIEEDQIGIWSHVLSNLDFDKKQEENRDRKKDIDYAYNIIAFPTKILVDPKGIVVGRYGMGGGNDEDMDRDLTNLFESINK